MKIILTALNAKFVHSNLAIRYIKAYSHMYDIELFETSINDNFMDTALNILEKKPDLVAFSCYLWNIDMALKVSSIIKEVSPTIRIVFGGPEVSYNGDEYLLKYPYLDYLMRGEGEITFYELIREITSGNKDFKNIDGLIYRSNEEVVINNERRPIENLDSIPFPYEYEIPGKILYYEASRGCPFRCSYCLSGSLGGIRFFGIDRVKTDLKKLIEAKVELVKFVDRTFNANKAFANAIWEFLINNAVAGQTKFHFEIAADLLDEDSMRILKKAPKDLFQFEVGVQSTNAEILKNINRIMNFDKVKSNILELKAAGNIHSHLDLIAGLPGENLSSFIKSFEDCMQIEPDVLQLGFLKVLKGTDIHRDLEKYGIHYMNHPNYHVLFTKDLAFEQLKYLLRFEKVFETYYNSGIYGVTIKYVLSMVEKKYEFFQEFTTYLENNEFFIRNFDLREKFRFLYEFLTTTKILTVEVEVETEAEVEAKVETQAEVEVEREAEITEHTGESTAQDETKVVVAVAVAAIEMEETEAMLLATSGKLDARVIKDLLIHDYISNTKKTALPEFLRKEITLETKELVMTNKEIITKFFNGVEVKKLFYIPVDTKVLKPASSGDYSILIENGVLIYNPVTGEYCYL